MPDCDIVCKKTMTHWENLYKTKSPSEIPWTGAGEKYLENIWEKYNIKTGIKILDVGCGRGDKSIYLSLKGNDVWGFDISPTAIEHAKSASENLKNPPTFFVANMAELGQHKEIKNVKFDVILDLVTSQFLSLEDKHSYLEAIKSNLVSDQTIYILYTFVKSDDMSQAQDWVKEIALSDEVFEQTYGKYFKVIDKTTKESPKGPIATYILQAK